jgi:predicted ATPase
MSLAGSDRFLVFVELLRAKVPSFKKYPFCLPAIKSLERLEFDPKVTFIIGENGTGKSTLLEAIAVASGYNAEGGSKNFGFATRESHSELHKFLRVARGIRKPKDGFFFRAESFYNVATAVENLGVTGYGDKSLHEQSHGESFWSLFTHRFRGQGVYIMDEPEAALSPTRQMAALLRIHQLVQGKSQLIIATHSPILMAYPQATILELSKTGVHKVRYEETDHFAISKRFFSDPKRILAELLREDSKTD